MWYNVLPTTRYKHQAAELRSGKIARPDRGEVFLVGVGVRQSSEAGAGLEDLEQPSAELLGGGLAAAGKAGKGKPVKCEKKRSIPKNSKDADREWILADKPLLIKPHVHLARLRVPREAGGRSKSNLQIVRCVLGDVGVEVERSKAEAANREVWKRRKAGHGGAARRPCEEGQRPRRRRQRQRRGQ